jgi:hypothetical protein
MRSYYRVTLGNKSAFAPKCFAGSYIGAGFLPNEDASKSLAEEWRGFKLVKS